MQVLESSQGGRAGSLMGALDNCTTPAGKRLLSQWLCRPLLHIADIAARQDAVQDLISPECAEAVGAARKAFSGELCSAPHHSLHMLLPIHALVKHLEHSWVLKATDSHVKQPGRIGCNLVSAILPGPITCLVSEDTMQ